MAARNLSASMLAEIVKGNVRPAILLEGEFVNADNGAQEFLRLWTGTGTLSWNGYSWLGAGSLLDISPIDETRDIKAVGFTVSMSGIAAADKQRALAGVRQNRPGKLWFALLDSTGAVIDEPYLLQRGKLDTSLLEETGDTARVTVQYESRLVDLEKARDRYYTPEDQKLDHPADEGFASVAALQDMEVLWGR